MKFSSIRYFTPLKSHSFLRILFEQSIRRIFLKFVPCFIDRNPKHKNLLLEFSDLSPVLHSLLKLALLKKFSEVVDSPNKPKRYMWNKKRGEFFIRGIVAMTPCRAFFLSQTITKWWSFRFFLNLRYFYMAFLGIRIERDLKKILRATIAAEVLIEMRPQPCRSDWSISVKLVDQVK